MYWQIYSINSSSTKSSKSYLLNPNFVIVVSLKSGVVSVNRVEGSFGIDSAKGLVDRVGASRSGRSSVGDRGDGREGRGGNSGRRKEEGGGEELHGEFDFRTVLCEKQVQKASKTTRKRRERKTQTRSA